MYHIKLTYTGNKCRNELITYIKNTFNSPYFTIQDIKITTKQTSTNLFPPLQHQKISIDYSVAPKYLDDNISNIIGKIFNSKKDLTLNRLVAPSPLEDEPAIQFDEETERFIINQQFAQYVALHQEYRAKLASMPNISEITVKSSRDPNTYNVSYTFHMTLKDNEENVVEQLNPFTKFADALGNSNELCRYIIEKNILGIDMYIKSDQVNFTFCISENYCIAVPNADLSMTETQQLRK